MTVSTVVVMGVAGSGKTTVMIALGQRLGWLTAEGDEFHSAANVEKMRTGRPLTDEDRWPWLDAIARWIEEREAAGQSSIVTCSALKRSYRDRLRRGNPSVWFVHLVVPESTLATRLERRAGHYMPPTLLTSQLDALEPLQPGERGVAIPADRSLPDLVDDIVKRLPRPTPKAERSACT